MTRLGIEPRSPRPLANTNHPLISPVESARNISISSLSTLAQEIWKSRFFQTLVIYPWLADLRRVLWPDSLRRQMAVRILCFFFEFSMSRSITLQFFRQIMWLRVAVSIVNSSNFTVEPSTTAVDLSLFSSDPSKFFQNLGSIWFFLRLLLVCPVSVVCGSFSSHVSFSGLV